MSRAEGAAPAGGWARQAEALVGTLVGGKYLIESVLGRGGMGTIYVAEQQPLGRRVALKVLHSRLGEMDADPEFHKRFLLEAATLSRLSHPNIVVVYDYGALEEDGAACFMAMELLEGKTINHVLAEQGAFTPARALRVTRDIARGLRASHQIGVVHRDLKPANVMLSPSPEGEVVKVLDFGLVKVLRDNSEELTAEGRFLGSPRYMSPEQIQRFDLDGRSDLYSLGVILFRMLADDVPFQGDHAVQILVAHMHEPAPRIVDVGGVEVPEAVETIVQRLLAKDPADRYEDASALIAAIDAVWPTLSSEPLPQSAEMPALTGYTVGAPFEPTPPSFSGVVPAVPAAAPQLDPDTFISGEGPALTAASPVAAVLPPIALAASADAQPAAGTDRAPHRLTIVLVITAAALLGLAGGAAIIATSPSGTGAEERSETPARGATEPAGTGLTDPSAAEFNTAQPDVSGSTPIAPTHFTLTVRSTPDGAEVRRGSALLGTTPLELEVEVDTPPTEYTVRARGRVPHTFTQGPSEDHVTHDVTLRRLPRRPPPGTAGGRMGIKTSR